MSKFGELINFEVPILLDFFGDSLSFLLFETDEKPFPFKSNSDVQAEGEVIEGDSEPEPETPNENSEAKEADTQPEKN